MKFLVSLATVVFCTSALAESELYVCERPTWGGHDGCGPNDTYSTHTFKVDTKDFDDEKPEYIYQGGKGCDVSRKSTYRYRYRVEDDEIIFSFARLPHNPRNKLWTTMTVDRGDLTAVMSGVDDSPNLQCRIE